MAIVVFSGRAIAFKPDDDTLFLVGSELGCIYLATTQAKKYQCFWLIFFYCILVFQLSIISCFYGT